MIFVPVCGSCPLCPDSEDALLPQGLTSAAKTFSYRQLQAVSSMGVLKGFQPTGLAQAQVSESAVCHTSASRDYCS